MDRIKQFFHSMWAGLQANLLFVLRTFKYSAIFLFAVGFILGAWVL